MIIWHHPLHHNNANVNDHDHHHHLNHNNNNDHHHLQTTPGKPFSLSSSTSSFRPRTVSTLFGSSSYFSFWISHHNHHHGHNFLHPCNFINCRHLWLPGYKLSSVSYPDPTKLNEISIFDFCVQMHLHIFLFSVQLHLHIFCVFFCSVMSDLNMTGFGVPHILQSRATESSVAGFTLQNNIHHYDEGGTTVIEIVLMSIFGND